MVTSTMLVTGLMRMALAFPNHLFNHPPQGSRLVKHLEVPMDSVLT
jgi:hypothetical protein